MFRSFIKEHNRFKPIYICLIILTIITSGMFTWLSFTEVHAQAVNRRFGYVFVDYGDINSISIRYGHVKDAELGYSSRSTGDASLIGSKIHWDDWGPFTYAYAPNGPYGPALEVRGDFADNTPFIRISGSKPGYYLADIYDETNGASMIGWWDGSGYVLDAGLYKGDWPNHSDDWNWDNACRDNGSWSALRFIWKPTSTPVTLNANGGTNINEQGQAQSNNFDLSFIGIRPTYGQPYFNDMKIRATRTGYDFAGWYNDPTGGEMVWDINGYAVRDNGSCNYWTGGGSRKWNELKWNLYCDWENMRWNNTSTDRQTFYAHWNPHHYFMVSNVNTPAEAHTAATGGWGSVITTYDDTNYGTAYTASCPGYTFLGWFTAGGEMIYNAQGQRCNNNSVFDNRGAWRWAGGNGAALTLYAHWANNPPANEWFKATELGTNNVWWANINNNNPANQGAITDTAKWSNKGYNFRLRGNDVGDGIRFAGILNENDCWFTSWNGNVTAGEWTKDITDDGIYSQVYGHVKDSAGQWRNTGAFKVYIDRQAPKINTFNVNIGAQKNLMPNADMSVIGSHPAVGNVYKDYDSTPYGSWVNVRISDANNNIKAIRGGSGAVSGINTVQVKVYDIKNPSHNKVYTLAQNPGINYEYSGILDTISDFSEVMELGYELTVTDHAGNTSTSEVKSTSRGIEVYSSIEKVDTDINGDTSFACGTRGIVHVFTTGWVDNVNVQFPDSFNKAWAYDEARGVPKPSLTPINYHTYGRNGFIRCWDIEFWIPMSLIDPDNPDHITPDPNGAINWPINVIGLDEYPYINTNLPGGTSGHGGSTPDATISVPSIPGNNKSILDQFRTIIKQDN